MIEPSPRYIAVFCGSSSGSEPEYVQAAKDLGAEIARRGLGLVFGGGNVGLMGALADSALSAGADVIGVMPHHLVEREIAHRGLTELCVVETMHQRKQRMIERADAFALLPGGFGSWEEFCEAVTWSQLGLHQKPCGILNVRGYYDPFVALLQRAVDHGFVHGTYRGAISVETSAEALVSALLQPRVPLHPKWTYPSDTAPR